MTPFQAVEIVESGDYEEDTVIGAWQYLIDTGIAWVLQGCYGRGAERMIEAGYCEPVEEQSNEGTQT